jgi:hypothetical protein
MLEKDPSLRPGMQEVRARMQEAHAQLTTGHGGSYDLPDRTDVEIRTPRVRRTFLAALAVAAAVAAVLYLVYLRPRPAAVPVRAVTPVAAPAAAGPTTPDVAPVAAPEPAPAATPEPAAVAPAEAPSGAAPVDKPGKRRKGARVRGSRGNAPPSSGSTPSPPPSPNDDGYMLNPFKDKK